MKKKLLLIISTCLLISLFISSCYKIEKKATKTFNISEENQDIKVKPYRVLVIIGDQWTDPMSYDIDSRCVQGTDFLDVISMLKIWGVPFDILRLDEQRLQINRFLDGEAKPNYGCVIWMADPDKLQGFSANYQTLKRIVKEYDISMIALFDNIKTKQVADLVGVDYQYVTDIQIGGSGDKFVISGEHFITKDAMNVILPDQNQIGRPSVPGANANTPKAGAVKEDLTSIKIVHCTATDSVKVLGSVGQIPQFVVRDINKDTKVIWIGGGKDWFRKYTVMREIFRKALVYSIGYGVFNDNFDNGFIFIMDDIGCSEHAWSLKWHYPTPSKEVLLKYLIEPLDKYGLMMVQNVTCGYANPETHMIEVPWSVKPFKDVFGNWQDYGSTKEGLDEGLRRGVFEIQPHRAWSHMNWDLESSPGPWWGSPIDGEMANTAWYSETVDVRRGYAPVPSNDLLFLYKTGKNAIEKAFGVVPLSTTVRRTEALKKGTIGGNNNGREAAIAGFGVSRDNYVGIDHTIEFSMMMPEQFTCHDLDLTVKTNDPADLPKPGGKSLSQLTTEECLASKIAGGRRINLTDNLDWINSHKDKHWMGFNECCAYLHTIIDSNEKNGLCIELNYDNHYCRYFEKNSSLWTLELSDRYREIMGKETVMSIDGMETKTVTGSKHVIKIPSGIGKHRIEMKSK